MKKTILLRSLLGAALGLAVNAVITIMISLAVGDGSYYAVVPRLADHLGGELNAVIFQAVLSMVYGAVFGGASLIWEKDDWSILRQTLTHLALCSLATFPVAYFCLWMPHSVLGALVYFGIFFSVYLVIWVSQYGAMKKRVRQLNEKVRAHND